MTNDARRNKYIYDKKAADRIVAFLTKRCRNIKGAQAGEPLQLVDWQEDFVRRLFGEKLPDGHRRYTYGFLWIPKKQGKSTMTSGLSLYLLGPDNEPGAEIYALAGDKDQARIVFDDARSMVDMDPYLSKAFRAYKNTIRYDKLKSVYKVLSAESETKHGFNVHGAIFDELHVQPNSKLWTTMTKGVAARENPMVLSLSNAGIKQTFPHEIYEICKAVVDGEKSLDHWLVRIYGDQIKDEDDPYDLKHIKEANPSFGKTVNERYYLNIIEETKQQPSTLNNYLRLHLGKWVGAYDSWIPLNEVNAASLKGDKQIDFKTLKNYDLYVGVDLSSSKDMTSVVFLYDTFDDFGFMFWHPFAYCPIERIKFRTESENVDYASWEEQGFLRSVAGRVIELPQIFEEYLDHSAGMNVIGLGYDAWRADEFIANIQKERSTKVFPVPQTPKYTSTPTSYIERGILKRILRHNANPLVTWQFGNVNIYTDSNDNQRIHKGKSKDKVDVPVSLVNALAVYETMRLKHRKPSIFTVKNPLVKNAKTA